MIRVFLLDDHEVVRRGVAATLDAEPDIDVVGEASETGDALAEVERCRPDVAVLDVRLADGNGIDVCRAIREEFPDVKTLILTSFDSDRAFVDAQRAGAAGFVLKEIRAANLIQAIRTVANGGSVLDHARARLATQRMRDSEEHLLEMLTPQERRIFDLIGEGRSNRQIAQEMYLAEKTVKNYVSNVLAKLGLSRRTEAAAIAARLAERHRHDV
jgi:DNA-binding NarL/FixJ family response regulator